MISVMFKDKQGKVICKYNSNDEPVETATVIYNSTLNHPKRPIFFLPGAWVFIGEADNGRWYLKC